MSPRSKVQFDRQRGILQITLVGRHTDRTIMSALDAAIASGEREAGMHRLWDLTGADLRGVNSRDVWRMTRHATSIPAEASGVRVAIVAATDEQFGLARQGTAMAEGRVSATWQVFRTVREAEAWLAEPAAD